MYLFLYDNGLRHERVKAAVSNKYGNRFILQLSARSAILVYLVLLVQEVIITRPSKVVAGQLSGKFNDFLL